MFHILVLSHGNLAEELVKTSEMIMGEQKSVLALGLEASESIEGFKSRLLDVFKQFKNRDVLVLTDLYGGTPTNAAIFTLLETSPNIEIVTGCNLSMLLEAIIDQNTSELKESVTRLIEMGCQGIVRVRDSLSTIDE